MILQALYELAQQENLVEDPDFEAKPVAWLVRIGSGGKLLGIEGTHYLPPAEGKKKPKPIAKCFTIPRQAGRSGIKAPPAFLVDNAKYVFGLATKDKAFKDEEGREKSAWFREVVEACARETQDEGCQALADFLRGVAEGSQVVKLPEECTSNELFAFIYAPDVDLLVHERPRVREYWKRQRMQVPAAGANGSAMRCLVSGEDVHEPGLFPLIKKVPGGTSSGVALVSFNSRAFESYGWSNNENAPISRAAAEACATALNRLLHPSFPKPGNPEETLPRRNLKLSEDTAVCYWSASSQEGDFTSCFASLLEADPDNVKELYQSLWRGKMPPEEDRSRFYALMLTGTQGRAVVRDWFESTVAAVERNLAAHFADLDIVRITPKPKQRELPPQFPLRVLMESLAPPGSSRAKGVPAPLAADFVLAALGGTPYPLAILQRALLRYRAELGKEQDDNDGWTTKQWNDARAALIKAVLNRKWRFGVPATQHSMEAKREMDPNNPSEGYALGRLMAVLERIQQEALGNPNASVVDRFFSGASATPRGVFVRLLKNARHHVKKAQDSGERSGTAILLDRLIDELAGRFDPKHNGFPAHLDLEQQGLFVLGYHHMRKWLWMGQEEREEWEKTHAAAPRAYMWKSAKLAKASSTATSETQEG